MQEFFAGVWEAVKLVPEGCVTTYGDIAKHLGRPRHARQVGYALHCNPDPDNIPCHRVVNGKGKVSEAFAFGGANMQYQLLLDEGVVFLNESFVDISKHRFIF